MKTHNILIYSQTGEVLGAYENITELSYISGTRLSFTTTENKKMSVSYPGGIVIAGEGEEV
jgi:hypothetical protein